MRLFTGLSLPPDVSARLLPFARIKEEKLHITTKFIGEWPEARLDALQAALATVRVGGPVDVHIGGLAWMSALVATVEATAGLVELARETERALCAIGVPKDARAYRPHVTLARSRSKELATPLDIPAFRADRFHLYLSAHGTYTILSDYPVP